VTLINCRDAWHFYFYLFIFIFCSIEKRDLFRHTISKREFHQFLELSSIKNYVTSEEIERYCSHLNELKLDYGKAF
jgi:hypothetical protein